MGISNPQLSYLPNIWKFQTINDRLNDRNRSRNLIRDLNFELNEEN